MTLTAADILPFLSRWRDDLPPLCDELRRIASGSEREFLAVGEALQGYYGRSGEITGTARVMLDLVSKEELSAVVADLRSMLADIDRYVAASRERNRKGGESLRMVRDLLCQVFLPLEGFGKMNKSLRMLSISTKIESARLGGAGASFVTLAMDVERLSHDVSMKSDSIRTRCRELMQLIDDSMGRLEVDSATQERELARIMEAIRENLGRLEELHHRFNAAGVTVSTVSDGVTSLLGEVVTGLQMHDITRQQMEHVVEALEKVPQEIGALASPDDESALRRLVEETGDVCELQHAQLSHAVDEMAGTVGAIRTILRDVGTRLASMVEELQAVSGVVGQDGGGSVVDEVTGGVRGIGAFLDECRTLDRDMQEILGRVGETVSQIATFVIDIRRIGSEIDLIALNSQIKAVHAGHDGAALAVLAEAIKRLSDEAVVQTAQLSDLLTAIDDTTAAMVTGDAGGVMGGDPLAMEGVLEDVLSRLAGMNGEIVSQIGRLVSGVSRLDDDIRGVTEGFQIDRVVSGECAPILQALKAIVDDSRRIHPPSDRFRENLRSLEKRYTMESERRIHDLVARGKGGEPRKGSPSPPVSSPAAVTSGDLGDNVELF